MLFSVLHICYAESIKALIIIMRQEFLWVRSFIGINGKVGIDIDITLLFLRSLHRWNKHRQVFGYHSTLPQVSIPRAGGRLLWGRKICLCLSQSCSWFNKRYHPQKFLPHIFWATTATTSFHHFQNMDNESLYNDLG